MQYDWSGVTRRRVRTLVAVADSPPHCSITSVSRQGRMMQSVKFMTWPRRIGLGLMAIGGGSALITTGLAAAVAQHEYLHAQFCHEVDHFGAVEPLVRVALSFI